MSPARREVLETVARQSFDVAIVGGGINGAAIALECARRKLSAVLLEQGDLASGTSSRSSRLIHGGVRYLEYARFHLVFESSRERRSLHRLVPHLARPLRFTWPVYAGARIPFWKLRLGLTLYDLLSLFRNFGRHQKLTPGEVLSEEPALAADKLEGGASYFDAATDDARLTLTNARAAMNNGATVLTYCRVESMAIDDKGVAVKFANRLSRSRHTVRARLVVNAAGPWSDSIIRMVDPDHAPLVHREKGAHIAVPRGRIGNRGALTLLVPSDGRVFFVLPAGSLSIIGTTDTSSTDAPDTTRASADDVNYLLTAANHYFPKAHLVPADVVSSWSGIRPISAANFTGNNTSASREHELRWTHDKMLSVLGGKLTTYRVVARDTVARLHRKLGRGTSAPLPDEQLPGSTLVSLAAEKVAAVQATGDEDVGRHLVDAHGAEWRDVWRLAMADSSLGRRIHPAHPYLRAEVVFAVRSELALTVADVLLRRTHLAFETRDHGASVAGDVAALMAGESGWTDKARDAAIKVYARDVKAFFGK